MRRVRPGNTRTPPGFEGDCIGDWLSATRGASTDGTWRGAGTPTHELHWWYWAGSTVVVNATRRSSDGVTPARRRARRYRYPGLSFPAAFNQRGCGRRNFWLCGDEAIRNAHQGHIVPIASNTLTAGRHLPDVSDGTAKQSVGEQWRGLSQLHLARSSDHRLPALRRKRRCRSTGVEEQGVGLRPRLSLQSRRRANLAPGGRQASSPPATFHNQVDERRAAPRFLCEGTAR